MATTTLHPLARTAIGALAHHDKAAWSALFAPDATFADDGNEGSITRFTEGAFGRGQEYFTRIGRTRTTKVG